MLLPAQYKPKRPAGGNRGIRQTGFLGKMADFVVLSEDLLTIDPRRIKDVEVDMTFVGGEAVYRR